MRRRSVVDLLRELRLKPWTVLGNVALAKRRSLTLAQRDRELSLRIDGVELMNSRIHTSEDVLGRLGAARVATEPQPTLLIGGLGMGFTLRAALDALPATATVTVVELVPEVIAWNRGPLAHLARQPLDDPRVRVVTGDVAKTIAAAPAAWDAIVLDVDNGPDALVDPHNDTLYSDRGVTRALRALRPGGCLSLWSAFEAPAMTKRLRRIGFHVDIEIVKAAGSRHYIWLARAPRAK